MAAEPALAPGSLAPPHHPEASAPRALQELQELQEALAWRPLVALVAPEGSAARAAQQPSAEPEVSAQLVQQEAPAVVARTAGRAPPERRWTMLPSGYCC